MLFYSVLYFTSICMLSSSWKVRHAFLKVVQVLHSLTLRSSVARYRSFINPFTKNVLNVLKFKANANQHSSFSIPVLTGKETQSLSSS